MLENGKGRVSSLDCTKRGGERAERGKVGDDDTYLWHIPIELYSMHFAEIAFY